MMDAIADVLNAAGIEPAFTGRDVESVDAAVCDALAALAERLRTGQAATEVLTKEVAAYQASSMHAEIAAALNERLSVQQRRINKQSKTDRLLAKTMRALLRDSLKGGGE